jgi:hypothetical protein
MTFPIALSMSPSSPSCVSAPRIGLVPPVPHSVVDFHLGEIKGDAFNICVPVWENPSEVAIEYE